MKFAGKRPKTQETCLHELMLLLRTAPVFISLLANLSESSNRTGATYNQPVESLPAGGCATTSLASTAVNARYEPHLAAAVEARRWYTFVSVSRSSCFEMVKVKFDGIICVCVLRSQQ